MKQALRIISDPAEMDQGLFGQIFLHILQILPYLDQQQIMPAWAIRTQHYGDPPDRLTLPGVLDLAYTPPAGPYRDVMLSELRRRHAHVLGNDWGRLNRLWNQFFRIPPRVLQAAKNYIPSGRLLGIHYRGTDKQTTGWDSNPISQQQYLALVRDFLADRKDFTAIFAATDEFSFVSQLQETVDLPVLSLGEVDFHMAAEHSISRREKADRALLDCVLLSQCACVVETSSALPSFAKLLNPDLEIYRCAASKLFGKLYTNMPYFPVAYIPILPVHSSESRSILEQTMREDWRERSEVRQYQVDFAAVPRWSRNHKVYRLAEKVGVDDVLKYVVRGWR